ncbi:MAG: type II toxin-antitoxin system Phd/YefM family antitoxin [Jatrophihabitantaceae bacterium]
MSEATVRELHNHGGQVLDRVLAGERVTITRDGKPVARLVPVGRGRSCELDFDALAYIYNVTSDHTMWP